MALLRNTQGALAALNAMSGGARARSSTTGRGRISRAGATDQPDRATGSHNHYDEESCFDLCVDIQTHVANQERISGAIFMAEMAGDDPLAAALNRLLDREVAATMDAKEQCHDLRCYCCTGTSNPYV